MHTSQKQGLSVYILSTIATVITLLISPESPELIGVLSILWAFLALAHILKYDEKNKKSATPKPSKHTTHLTSALAYDITHCMRHARNEGNTTTESKFLNIKTMVWLSIATIYAICSLYLIKSAVSAPEIIEKISTFFIIGATFWIGQNYAHNRNASYIIVSIFSVLAIITLIQTYDQIPIFTNIDIQNNLLKTGISPATYILLFLAIYCITSSLYAGISFIKKLPLALICTALIIFMCGLYIIVPDHTALPLWIALWGLFSALWVSCFNKGTRQYILYQCQ